ncbi:hypothetical protein LCGC14_2268170, partial [marine sediment metagenome]
MLTAKRGCLIAAAAVLCLAGGALGKITVLQQGAGPGADQAGCKDTWVGEGRYEKNRNNSLSQTLACGGKRNVLIRFDVSGLAKGTKVNKAILRLWDADYPRKGKDGKFASLLGAFRLTREWNDDGTWKHHTRPARRKEKEPNAELEW